MRDYPLDYFEKNFIEPLGFNLSEIKVLPESILEYPKQKVKKQVKLTVNNNSQGFQ